MIETIIALVSADIYAIAAIVAALALVGATLYLAHVTRQYVELTKALVESQTNPLLYLDAELIERHSILNVFVKNVGQGFACNMELGVVKNKEGEDDFVFLVRQNIHKFKEEIAKNSVSRLAPHQKKSLAMIPLADNLRKLDNRIGVMEDLKKPREVKVGYTNTRKKKCGQQHHLLDFPYWIRLWEIDNIIDDIYQT